MQTRPLEVADCPKVRALAQKLAATMYPELISDIEKVHWLVRDVTNNTKHFARVVGQKGDPGAVLIACAGNNVWAMKRHATVMVWYSEIPGAGAKLLREFREWVKEGQDIVLGGFSCDWVMTDDRPLKLASRIGFKQRGCGTYLFFPRGSMAK